MEKTPSYSKYADDKNVSEVCDLLATFTALTLTHLCVLVCLFDVLGDELDPLERAKIAKNRICD